MKKKVISILIAASVVTSLMFALSGTALAWGQADGDARADSTGSWTNASVGTTDGNARTRIGHQVIPGGPAGSYADGGPTWEARSRGTAITGDGNHPHGSRAHILLEGWASGGGTSDGLAFALSMHGREGSRAYAESVHTALDGGETYTEARANAFQSAWGIGRPWRNGPARGAEAFAWGESVGEGSETTVISNANTGHESENRSGHQARSIADGRGWAGGGSFTHVTADANSEDRSRATAIGDGYANQESSAHVDSDADAGSSTSSSAWSEAIAEADQASDADAVADADAILYSEAEAYGTAIADIISYAEADGSARAEDYSDAYANAYAFADRYSNAEAELDPGDYGVILLLDEEPAQEYGWSGELGPWEWIGAQAIADADAMYDGYADAYAEALADQNSVAMAKADAEDKYGFDLDSAYADALADADFMSGAVAVTEVKNEAGTWADGMTSAEASFDSDAIALLDIDQEGPMERNHIVGIQDGPVIQQLPGRWRVISDGEVIANADFDSTAIAMATLSNEVSVYDNGEPCEPPFIGGGLAGGRASADANFGSNAISALVVDNQGQIGPRIRTQNENGYGYHGHAVGGTHANADFLSMAVAVGTSTTVAENEPDGHGKRAAGRATADSIFESKTIAAYEASSVNGGTAEAEAESHAICESVAVTQVTAYADGYDVFAKADGRAQAVAFGNAEAIAKAEAARPDDFRTRATPKAEATATAHAALGGDALSFAWADATMEEPSVGFVRDSATDFSAGGAAWAWGVANGERGIALAGATTVAILGWTATATAEADTDGTPALGPNDTASPRVAVLAVMEAPAP